MLMNREKLTKTVTLLSLVFFIGSMGASFIGLFNGGQTKSAQTSSATDPKAQLKLQEEGYLTVLKREPKNQTALQGLVDIRLASNDFKGAVQPLETLAELQPNDETLKTLLTQVKSKAGS